MARRFAFLKFHDNATTVGDGVVYDVRSETNMVLEITGTATSFAIEILGSVSGDVGTFKPIGDSYTKTTLGTGYQFTSKDELISVPLVGISKIMVKLTSVVGGNITVVANVMEE